MRTTIINRDIYLSLLTILLVLLTAIAGKAQADQAIRLVPLDSYSTGIFGESAAEIADFDPSSGRIFFTNALANTIDILDASDPSALSYISSIDLAPYGGGVNSVVVLNGAIAVAVEANVKQDPGVVVLFDTNGNFLSQVTVGALPDMITLTPDGTALITANEGEPSDDYLNDPVGSVSIIDLSVGYGNLTNADVTTIGFENFILEDYPGLRVFGPGATLAQDMEPEYVTVTEDSQTAYVSCQENNALAVVDLVSKTITDLLPLGTKDHSLAMNAMDVSNNDGVINITTWPVKGLFMPDAIKTYQVAGQAYIVTANEGDSRDYDGFSEEDRVRDLDLDSIAFPNAADLQANANLGRLNITTTLGDADNDGFYEELYCYGARSFSIWNANGELVFDSGSEFERIIADQNPDNFNSTNAENDSFDARSDDKGPEPEAVEIAELNGHSYAFIGLERIGGIMIYDITDPSSPSFVQYFNNRDFSVELSAGVGGDSGVEGLTFVSAADSPNGQPLLISSNEVSGTVTVFQIIVPDYTLQLLHASDLEGGVDAIGRAPFFAGIIDRVEDTYTNSITLSAGDNYIPGPFFNASGDGSVRPVLQDVYQDLFSEPGLTNLREANGRSDISIMNIIGFDASAFGNHEFDATTSAISDIVRTDIRGAGLGDVRWLGSQFPYLSANLDFSADEALSDLYTSEILSNEAFKSLPSDLEAAADAPKIAPATYIERDGETIGVIGATTQLIASISSPGTTVETTGGVNDMPALAAVIQSIVDQMNSEGVDKIILVSHLQQLALEQQLSGLLSGVDIIIAGGSDAILADENDRLEAGSVADGSYPVISSDLDGNATLIVSTDGEYSYVGRLVVGFDADGHIILESLDEGVNGPILSDEESIATLWGAEDYLVTNSKAELVSRLTGAIQNVVIQKDGNILGKSSVYLDGRRSQVRTQETNLGNISADANLWQAKQYDAEVQVSIKNGGGIRAALGEVVEVSPGVYEFLPTQANPLSGKNAEEVSQLDVENSLRFNNQLSLVTVTAQGLKAIMEHAFSASAPGATPGQFPQIGGMKVSFDPSLPAGSRIQELWILDEEGGLSDVIVSEGAVYGAPLREIRVVTLNFLAGGGDSYPFPALSYERVDLVTVLTDEGQFNFAGAGTEQDAIAEYFGTFFSEEAFSEAETSVEEDERIQQLDTRDSDLGLCQEDLFTDAPGSPLTVFANLFSENFAASGIWDPYLGADECQIRAGRLIEGTFEFLNMENLLYRIVDESRVSPPINSLGFGIRLINNPRFITIPGASYGWQVSCSCADYSSPWSEITELTTFTIPSEFGAGKSLSSSENISIKLFPNPVIDGELNISLEAYSSEVELLQIRVYDALGQLVLDEQMNQNKGMVRVDVSSLSSGVYTLQFSAGDTQSSGRFFIK